MTPLCLQDLQFYYCLGFASVVVLFVVEESCYFAFGAVGWNRIRVEHIMIVLL
uniref:Uncharacterized protein n=1 Tax=Arundo donax TaxID=35708 RepID=A0A0A8YJY2_ARUDO